MTNDERCVLRWLLLSPAERITSEMGAPSMAILRVADRLRYRQSVAPGIKKREKDIIALARDIMMS